MVEKGAMPIPRILSGIAPAALSHLGENGGFDLDIDANGTIPVAESPILDAIHTTYDVEQFSIARTPIVIGNVVLSGLGDEFTISDMAIKWPGNNYRVPIELLAFRSLLTKCASVEVKINPYLDDYYAYLSIQRATVTQGDTKRGEGAHSDSVQGPRIQPKVPIEHGYLFCDRDPTLFYTHSFDLSGLDPNKDWLNNAIVSQADRTRSVIYKSGDIVLFDAYTVHEALPAKDNALRTFARLLYSVRPFDRLGNTRNDLFEYDWDFYPRPLPRGLHGLPN